MLTIFKHFYIKKNIIILHLIFSMTSKIVELKPKQKLIIENVMIFYKF